MATNFVAMRLGTPLPVAVVANGDSTAHGDGGSGTYWLTVAGALLSPVPTQVNDGHGGETSAQCLARVQADTAHPSYMRVFMDYPGGGETAAGWLSDAAGILAVEPRTMIWPPVQNTDGSFSQVIADIQTGLLTAPYAKNTLDAAQQATWIAFASSPSTRSDNLHFNATGQTQQGQTIAAWWLSHNSIPPCVSV